MQSWGTGLPSPSCKILCNPQTVAQTSLVSHGIAGQVFASNMQLLVTHSRSTGSSSRSGRSCSSRRVEVSVAAGVAAISNKNNNNNDNSNKGAGGGSRIVVPAAAVRRSSRSTNVIVVSANTVILGGTKISM